MPTSHMTFFRLTQEGKKHFLGSVIWGMVMRADISHWKHPEATARWYFQNAHQETPGRSELAAGTRWG